MMLAGRVFEALAAAEAALMEAGEHELAPLIMPPLAFAGIAAAIFITLAIVTYSFRDVANRHSNVSSRDSQDSVH